MYLPIEFSCFSSAWDKLTEEEYLRLQTVMPTLPVEKPSYYAVGTHIMTEEAIPVLQELKLEIKVSEEQDRGLGQMLVKLQDRINDLQLKDRQRDLAELARRGAAVQVSVPGFALMAVTEVQVLEDACTDYLQDELNKGWQIIAVCPPNTQRRPDYILGRSRAREEQRGGC